MAGVVPVLRPELGCTYEVRTSQHRQEGVECHLDACGFALQRLSFGVAQVSQNFRSS